MDAWETRFLISRYISFLIKIELTTRFVEITVVFFPHNLILLTYQNSYETQIKFIYIYPSLYSDKQIHFKNSQLLKKLCLHYWSKLWCAWHFPYKKNQMQVTLLTDTTRLFRVKTGHWVSQGYSSYGKRTVVICSSNNRLIVCHGFIVRKDRIEE